MDHFKERIPLLGNIYRYSGVAQIARSLSSLLSGGTSLVEAMRITQASTAHRAQAARLSTAIAQVTEGKSLAQAMQSTGLLPRSAIKMVEVGEATGGLDAMLGEVATFYEESLEHTLSRIMILIEPILMLLMGVLVGGTIIVMYLPIFYIVDVIK
jgi:type IV pilus assembly protein PilC